jgi:hypothetical protein
MQKSKNKILEEEIGEHITRKIHHDQVRYISGPQG